LKKLHYMHFLHIHKSQCMLSKRYTIYVYKNIQKSLFSQIVCGHVLTVFWKIKTNFTSFYEYRLLVKAVLYFTFFTVVKNLSCITIWQTYFKTELAFVPSLPHIVLFCDFFFIILLYFYRYLYKQFKQLYTIMISRTHVKHEIETRIP